MADIILGIESSCDDTSAAVLRDGVLLSNVIASQQVHKDFGGVVPELASRAHEQNIVPVVSEALRKAGVAPEELTAIAFTRGPGLLGSLLVGTSFAKALSLSLDIPMVMVNHLQGHILANFVRQPDKPVDEPSFPYLCLLVSGGNSQIVKVNSPLEYEILGQTIDDAVGEAFDKCSKMLGLGYPGGPVIDRLAKLGDPNRFHFAKPNIPGLDYSFSGIKTSLLYFVRDEMAKDPEFLEKNKEDLCASFQKTLIDILMGKLIRAAKETKIKDQADHHRRRRFRQQRPPRADRRRGPEARLEDLPPRVQVHNRQCGDDRRRRLVPLQGRRAHSPGRRPRLQDGGLLGNQLAE